MKLIVALIMSLFLVSCDFYVDDANKKFGKQNFVSAISMIELHKTRNGVYPENLKELQYLGDWDAIWLSAVRYEKVEGGYNLFVERGWISEPKLEFPIGFKHGLGLKDSNIKWISQ